MTADGTINQRFNKKEGLGMQREMEKLERSVGGIKDMRGVPDAVFVFDVGYEKNAVNEARKLGIPVIGIVDTNNSPELVDYMIPGNDDSIRSIKLYCQTASAAVLEAKAASLGGVKDDFVEMSEGVDAKVSAAE
jgi:SSU ribosomal protein S2P